MDKKVKEHLKRVLKEVKELVKEYEEDPENFGVLDNRLFWAIKGIDPKTDVCTKHKYKFFRNALGEYFCPECDYMTSTWIDSDGNEIKITGIKKGL